MKYENEHMYYLSKLGADRIDGKPQKKLAQRAMAHTVLRNEAYLWLKCPDNWYVEQPIDISGGAENKIIKPDAFYFIGEDLYCVEIDLKQKMTVNREKLEKYKILTENYYHDTKRKPIVQFFTSVESRKDLLMQIAEENFVHLEVHILHV